MKKAFVALLLLVGAVSAFSQASSDLSAAIVAWPQEPSSFLGVRFGEPLRSSVNECPKIIEYGSIRYEWVGFGRPCFEPISGFYEIYNVNPFFDVFVTEVDGQVGEISATFNNGNAANLSGTDASGIASALTEKFGTAHISGTKIVHSNAGAAFEDHILKWRGKSVEIDFDSVSGQYNRGLVSAYTAVFAAREAQMHAQEKNVVKGIL